MQEYQSQAVEEEKLQLPVAAFMQNLSNPVHRAKLQVCVLHPAVHWGVGEYGGLEKGVQRMARGLLLHVHWVYTELPIPHPAAHASIRSFCCRSTLSISCWIHGESPSYSLPCLLAVQDSPHHGRLRLATGILIVLYLLTQVEGGRAHISQTAGLLPGSYRQQRLLPVTHTAHQVVHHLSEASKSAGHQSKSGANSKHGYGTFIRVCRALPPPLPLFFATHHSPRPAFPSLYLSRITVSSH